MADQLLPESPSTDARLASYRTLLEVSRMLLASATLSELFERITTELKRLVPFDAVTIYRVDELAELLTPVHTVDRWAERDHGVAQRPRGGRHRLGGASAARR